MDSSHMSPFGSALMDFYNTKRTGEIIIRRDDGFESAIPMQHFFRPPEQFSEIEVSALARCRGQVLDIGAGSGIHSLFLQSKGIRVTALDICRQAVDIMRDRGLEDVYQDNIFDFQHGHFDTILMLGHGIGMVETIKGLKKFLEHIQNLLSEKGILILDSLDVRRTDSPAHLSYHEKNRHAGRYIGETRIQFEYASDTGPYCGWLHIDSQTLVKYARQADLIAKIICESENGEYLAQISKNTS